MNVAILGCGPAGLLSAHACMLEGIEPHIISRPEKSSIPGSVYLHRPVPALTAIYPENHVQYIRLGNEEGYAQKVYGDPCTNTGWEHYFQLYPSWNAVKAYDLLWERWHKKIDPRMELGDGELLREIILGHDLVISTVPAQVLCFKRHSFDGEPYWIKTLPVPKLDAHKDIVIYNGLERDLWYRWSVLSGVCSIESTREIWSPFDGDVVEGIKPRSNTCDCWPTVVRAGRWAEWRHGVLLNDAFETALNAIRELKHGRTIDSHPARV